MFARTLTLNNTSYITKAIFPIGDTLTGTAAAESFFNAYLAVPVMMLFWIGGYVWKRGKPKRASAIDLDVRDWLLLHR